MDPLPPSQKVWLDPPGTCITVSSITVPEKVLGHLRPLESFAGEERLKIGSFHSQGCLSSHLTQVGIGFLQVDVVVQGQQHQSFFPALIAFFPAWNRT